MDDEPDAEDDAEDADGTPASSAVEQFQRAALDAVHAARALLDAAESVIQEPAALESMVRSVTDVARTASEAVVGFAAANDPRRAHDPRGTDDDTPDEGPDGFEPISVD